MNAKQLLGRRVIAAIKRYRDNRKAAFSSGNNPPWNKTADLMYINMCVAKRRGLKGFFELGGRFYFYFPKGVTVEVDASWYWRPKIVTPWRQVGPLFVRNWK